MKSSYPNILHNKKGWSILHAINIACNKQCVPKKIFKIKIFEIYTFEHIPTLSTLAKQTKITNFFP